MTETESILKLTEDFLAKRLDVNAFCEVFTRLWMNIRDAEYERKKNWPEPYDEKLLASVGRGDISKDEFSKRWGELWGLSDVRSFHDMIDPIHSACSVYDPMPESEWEIDEDQLRTEVTERLRIYNLEARTD